MRQPERASEYAETLVDGEIRGRALVTAVEDRARLFAAQRMTLPAGVFRKYFLRCNTR